MSEFSNTFTVLIFLKAPRAGRVKTRLARGIGSEAALRAYRKLAEKQLAAMDREWNVEVHYAPSDALQEMRVWLGESFTYVPQPEGDLGERLMSAVNRHFRRSRGPLLLVGADCPWLDSGCLTAAFEALVTCDVAIGPTHDGGYYTLGLKGDNLSLFENIDWSTESVFQQTLERARAENLTVSTLEILHDVDTLAEWKQALQHFPDLNK